MIAYLNTEYPSLSHTFIEREIRALRELGVPVTTFSVRRPGKHGTLGAAHERAASGTVYLKESGGSLLLRGAIAALRSPLGMLRALVASQRLSPPGLKARISHVAYALEGARLAIEMRRRGIIHVHVHMANNGAAVAMMASAFDPKIAYSLSIHGSAEFFHVDTWTLREKVAGATFVRCISNFCRAQVMAWTSPQLWDRLSVVHCGVDVSVFAMQPRVRTDTVRLLTVGRLHPIKAYPLLLEACRSLDAIGLKWELEMIGDGPQAADLRRLASELGIADRVRFAGAVSQDAIIEHYRNADVMIVSSCMEGVPVVLMEAMATGMIVVSTNVGGIPELVRTDSSGVLCPPGSADALADAIASVAKQPERWPEWAGAARATIEREFSIGGSALGMKRLFERHGVIAPG